MLFSNSPVKKVVEKLNPFSQKNKVSRLKFERKSDYRTFLKFIKDNTKEIEDIDISGEDKKRKGFMLGGALLGLGLLGSFGKGKRDSDDGTGKLQSISGVIEKAKADSRKAISGDKTRRNLDTASDVIKINRKRRVINKKFSPDIPEKVNLSKSKIDTDKLLKNKSSVENEKKIGVKQERGQTTTGGTKYRNMQKQVGDNTTGKKTSTATIDDFINADDPFDVKPKQSSNQGKQGPTGGTRGRSGANQPDLSEFERMVKRADEIDQRIKQQLNDPNFRVPDKIKKEINYINKRLNERDLRPSTRKRLTDRLSNINKNIKEIQTQNKKFKSSKFFEAPEIPKNETKKLSRLDRFTGGVNRINKFLSPVSNFASAIYRPKNYLKFLLIKDMLKVEPFADGTLTGVMDIKGRLPGDGGYDESTKGQYVESVNIFDFSEGRKSAIPFDANIKEPLVSQPSNLQAPINNIFVDFEFNTTEDLFFMKMGGS